MRRDWLKARDSLLSLRAQRELDAVSVRESGELARLTYESYRAGRSTLIEVQSANLRQMEAAVLAARTNAQILLQLAVLRDLSEE